MATKEIKSNEFKTLEDFDYKKEDIIIIESLSKTTIVKPFLKILNEITNCSLCNRKITNSIKCSLCAQYFYCSDDCRLKDSTHIEFHKKISSFYEKPVKEQDLKDVPINDYLTITSKGGLAGMKNLGGTSFMNSALQCLSHDIELTKFFLSKAFLNQNNRREGNISKLYYGLVKDLWIGSNPIIQPWDFRNLFFSFVKQLGGNLAQDAAEMLAFLLGGLHEDLNRIRERPEKSEFYPQIIGQESDEVASKRWQDNCSARESSIISDLFHGQYKSQVKCNSCKKNIITYEPFMCLALQIAEKNMSRVRLKVFPNDYNYQFFYVELSEVLKTTTIKDFKSKIRNKRQYRIAEFDAILLKNKEVSKILSDEELVYDLVYTKLDFTLEEFIDIEIIFVEVETSSLSKNKGDYVTFYIQPSHLIDQQSYYFFKYKTAKALMLPRAISISKKARIKDLFIEVFKYYRMAMHDMTIKNEQEDLLLDSKYYSNFYENIKNKEFIEKEFDNCYLRSNDNTVLNETIENINLTEKSNSSVNKKLFELYLVNNIPVPNSYFSRKPACEFCKNGSCSFCKINFNFEAKIYELYATQIHTREFFIIADFSNHPKSNFRQFYGEYVDPTDPKVNFKGEVSIYDCLDNFQKEEKTTKEKPYACPNCQRNTEAVKRTEIYRLPNHLIIQFKRFKFGGFKDLMEMANNKKNDTFIDFPLENFDLSSYVIGPNRDNCVYELFAVSQHHGDLKSNNFTAICKNRGKWTTFNDEVVTKSDQSDVCNQFAYVLLYKKVNPLENSKEISSPDKNVLLTEKAIN